MTRDVVALVEAEPDLDAVLAGLVAAGAGYRVGKAADGGVLQLCDDHDRLLVSIEVPVLVQVDGEVKRLLGPEVADVAPPVWWVEARAAHAAPGAETLALRFAAELVRRLGGTVWMDDPAYARSLR
ncbi:hypothetical protein DPM19_26730 [Actinomadura craniellae]|uniref:Uncharacterized protein n=1 Tax=Actinomadura craniellae TaxID=2231787 RepID=A0A365H185_9ACTN|nr:hypothetical protein [Actinomadura craniellae]RAY11953.1 hypothetical protein DPM19_26730 [Actinomadura craniellae]